MTGLFIGEIYSQTGTVLDIIEKNLKSMNTNKKSTTPLLVAGLAAFAYYKYKKMSPEEKDNLVGTMKQKGMDLYEKYIPQSIKDVIGLKSKDEGTIHVS